MQLKWNYIAGNLIQITCTHTLFEICYFHFFLFLAFFFACRLNSSFHRLCIGQLFPIRCLSLLNYLFILFIIIYNFNFYLFFTLILFIFFVLFWQYLFVFIHVLYLDCLFQLFFLFEWSHGFLF